MPTTTCAVSHCAASASWSTRRSARCGGRLVCCPSWSNVCRRLHIMSLCLNLYNNAATPFRSYVLVCTRQDTLHRKASATVYGPRPRCQVFTRCSRTCVREAASAARHGRADMTACVVLAALGSAQRQVPRQVVCQDLAVDCGGGTAAAAAVAATAASATSAPQAGRRLAMLRRRPAAAAQHGVFPLQANLHSVIV